MVNIPQPASRLLKVAASFSVTRPLLGKIDRRTPLLNSKIHEVILNPYWTAPKSIIQKDIIPLMRKDPEYLTKNKIRLYDQSGQEVPPESVDWNTDDAVKLMFRQDPGKINAMSSTKINFHQSLCGLYARYAAEELFQQAHAFRLIGLCARAECARSRPSGCSRIPLGWDRQNIEATIRSGVNTPIQLADPVRCTSSISVPGPRVTVWCSSAMISTRWMAFNRTGAGTDT